ncbi:MAG TPA: hypothetical protein P5569_11935 [Candidatus Latescibacteria bacterium]|nr:hypothetical protein [Candidatus Latescibacterota bacterium]HRU24647.1 hypothetical protein [Candidatus Latescibacterota bacterium]
MKQHEAVIEVMKGNGGYATLGFLYQNVLKVQDCKWNTRTPFASIRRIVQDDRFFFKIRPGLWALKTEKNRLPDDILPQAKQPETKNDEYSHTYYQGLLVEIGNLRRYQTFVPSQDRNKRYLGKKLCDVVAIREMYRFSYEHVVNIAQTVDVMWFNERKMPAGLFEIEHSTDMHRSLLKFVELQDFFTNFRIVADEVRRREFQGKVSLRAFSAINRRVEFWCYEDVAKLHSKTSEYASIEARMNL